MNAKKNEPVINGCLLLQQVGKEGKESTVIQVGDVLTFRFDGVFRVSLDRRFALNKPGEEGQLLFSGGMTLTTSLPNIHDAHEKLIIEGIKNRLSMMNFIQLISCLTGFRLKQTRSDEYLEQYEFIN